MSTGFKIEDGREFITHVQDGREISAIMKQCEIDRQHAPGTFEKKGEFRRSFRIPMGLLTKFQYELGLDFMNPEHAKVILKLLEQPEYSKFRCYNGQR